MASDSRTTLPMNVFHDVSRFPADPGILVFWISMSRISNAQSAERCFEYVESLSPKIAQPNVGLVFAYSDSLYLYSESRADSLKNSHLGAMLSHRDWFMKKLKGTWYVPKAFSFLAWNQWLLNAEVNFTTYFGKLREIYDADSTFQRFLSEDAGSNGRDLTDNQISFFLEEILLFYLTSKGVVRMPNTYVNGSEKWLLHCYPGKPLKSEAYLFQKNFFKLANPENAYENSFYDLEEKKLYDFLRMDLDNWAVS